jgi:hypothetical protein
MPKKRGIPRKKSPKQRNPKKGRIYGGNEEASKKN